MQSQTTSTEPSTSETPTQAAAQRIQWVDVCRGIGIFLVVLGHTLRGVTPSVIGYNDVTIFVDRYIYAFHMPLFFILAGLFLPRSLAKGRKPYLTDKLRTVVYAYLLWSLLQGLLQIAMSRYTNNPPAWGDLAKILYQPQMQYWFLYVLFLGQVLYMLSGKGRAAAWVFAGATMVMWVVEDFVDLGTWSPLIQLHKFALFIAMGVLIGSLDLSRRIERIKTPYALGAAALGYAGVGLVFLENTLSPDIIGLAAALCGSAATVAISVVLSRTPANKALSLWGIRSLEIFVAHTICSAAFRIVMMQLFKVTDPTVHIIGGTAIGIFLPLLLCHLTDRVGATWLFTLKKPTRKKPKEAQGFAMP